MRQATLLFSIFFLSVLMAAAQTSADTNGQGTTSNSSANAAQSNAGSANQPATAPAPPSVNVTDAAQSNSSQMAPAATSTGATTTGAPSEPRIVTPPTVSLGVSATSPVGASNATPGNQAGASNSTLAPNSSGMEVSNPSATTPVLPNMNTSATSSTPAAKGGVAWYPGLPDSAWSMGETDGSVAEASRRYQTAKAMRHPHTYTNDDIARLNQNAAPQMPNANSNQPPVTNPSTMPASDVTTPQGSAAPSTPANEQAPAAPPTTANPQTQKKSPFASKPAPPQN
jgi:hypothetical protein